MNLLSLGFGPPELELNIVRITKNKCCAALRIGYRRVHHSKSCEPPLPDVKFVATLYGESDVIKPRAALIKEFARMPLMLVEPDYESGSRVEKNDHYAFREFHSSDPPKPKNLILDTLLGEVGLENAYGEGTSCQLAPHRRR